MTTNRPLPMLAKPYTDRILITPGRYFGEEKFDGQRMITYMAPTNLQDAGNLQFWSRTGKDTMGKKVGIELMKSLVNLPLGLMLDGELVVPNTYSSQTDFDYQTKGVYIVFDILYFNDKEITRNSYCTRRLLLEQLFAVLGELPRVQLAQSVRVNSRQEVEALAQGVWDEKGEGVIIKDGDAPYTAGKRTSAFLKLKDFGIAGLEVMGFAESKGEINHRGPAAITVLKDADDNWTVVKTLDDDTCRKLEQRFTGERWHEQKIAGKWVKFNTAHMDVGRILMIEYHIRTPDGSYRSGRWDRWEDE